MPRVNHVPVGVIDRIYGEHGEEILELLRKNPAGTIPVVLKVGLLTNPGHSLFGE